MKDEDYYSIQSQNKQSIANVPNAVAAPGGVRMKIARGTINGIRSHIHKVSETWTVPNICFINVSCSGYS